jgi:hypothetical protein
LAILEEVAGKTSLDISDSVVITETEVTETAFERSQDDSISIAEAMAGEVAKSFSDTVGVVEEEQKEVIGEKVETVSLTEGEVITVNLVLTDTLLIADLGGQSFHLTFDDAISITETIAPLILTRLLPTDSISFSESLVFEIGVAKTETEGIGESVGNSYNLNISDSTTIVESETETTSKEGLTDAITITEDLVKDVILVLDDSLDIVEVKTDTENHYRTFADSVGITETSIVKPGRALTDNISIAEGLTQSLKLYFAETLTLTEGLESVNEFYRTGSESLSLAESSSRKPTIPRTDGISFAESSMRAITVKPSESLPILEDCMPDIQATERIGQKTFLRTSRAQ